MGEHQATLSPTASGALTDVPDQPDRMGPPCPGGGGGGGGCKFRNKIIVTSLSYTGRGMQYTVEPLIMDTLNSGQPPYNGHTVHPLPCCPYISTSGEGTTALQWTKCSPPASIHFYLRGGREGGRERGREKERMGERDGREGMKVAERKSICIKEG